MDCIKSTDWVTGKRLPRTINYFGSDPHHLPMRGCRNKVRSTVRRFGFSQFPERDGPQQYAITLDQGQIRSNNDFRLAE